MEKLFQIRVGGLTFINNKLLLITHKKNNKEYWVIPGGRVNFGEKAENAIIREFKEELNLDVKVLEFLCYNEALPPSYPIHTLNLFFLLKPLSQNISLEKNSIINKYKFFDKSELKNLVLYPEIKDTIYKNFDIWVKKV